MVIKEHIKVSIAEPSMSRKEHLWGIKGFKWTHVPPPNTKGLLPGARIWAQVNRVALILTNGSNGKI